MNNDEITVVIPYYNDSCRIKKCIRSVLKQTLAPKEIILIDDASDDSSDLQEILAIIDFKSVKFKCIRNKKNMNGAYSRNLGMGQAVGGYVALLDADDYWRPDHLKESCDFLTKHAADFIYSNKVCEGPKYTYIKKSTDIFDCINKSDILLMSPPQTNSFFFKREVFNVVKFDEELRRHQDYQFLLDVVNADLYVKYNDVNTAVYTESHRPVGQRYQIDNSLSFWEARCLSFSPVMFRRKLVELMIIYLEVDPSGFNETMNKKEMYGFVTKSLVFGFLFKIRKVSPTLFKSILKIVYLHDFSFIVKTIIRKKIE
ncbi:MAG: glycosyltransferase family A protein [Gammaproteobacteria bacterium]